MESHRSRDDAHAMRQTPTQCMLQRASVPPTASMNNHAPPTRMLLTGMWTVQSSSVSKRALWQFKRGALASHTQFDKVSNSPHDDEAHAYCLRNFDKLAFVRCRTKEASAYGQKGSPAGLHRPERDIRFVQRLRKRVPSLRKSRGMSAISLSCSDMAVCEGRGKLEERCDGRR